MTPVRIILGVAALLLAAGGPARSPAAESVAGATATADGEWAAFGRDPGGSQHSPLAQIDTRNVKRLRQVWSHRSGDFIDAPSPRGTTSWTGCSTTSRSSWRR